MAKLIGLILTVLCTVNAQHKPFAVLYSGPDCFGEFVYLPTDNYTPDLETLFFDNHAYSVLMTGTWLFYDNKDFNSGNRGTMYNFQSSTECVDLIGFEGYISSAKFVGSNVDYRVDTITFYEHTYFQAGEEYVEMDILILELQGRIASLIVTGDSAWTIYDNINYLGSAICLQPESSPVYEPVFVPDTILLNQTVPHGSISSVRKGCFTDNIVKLPVSKSSGDHIPIFSNSKVDQCC